MGIIRFEKEEDKQSYLDWREQNAQGYVLNINTWNPKATTYKNIIHKASWCSSLDTPPTANRDRPIAPEHPKLCSTDIRELESEMIINDLPYKLCGLCRPTVI
jgi:hypothetical protein